MIVCAIKEYSGGFILYSDTSFSIQEDNASRKVIEVLFELAGGTLSEDGWSIQMPNQYDFQKHINILKEIGFKYIGHSTFSFEYKKNDELKNLLKKLERRRSPKVKSFKDFYK